MNVVMFCDMIYYCMSIIMWVNYWMHCTSIQVILLYCVHINIYIFNDNYNNIIQSCMHMYMSAGVEENLIGGAVYLYI